MCRNYNSSKRSLVTTLVVLAICAVIVTGSTFSLFTSESNVNIAITAGNVKMTAKINEALTLYSKDVKQTTGKFENGGTATLNEEKTTLTVANITPGDKVELKINLKNESNVDVAYRVTWSVEGELAGVLTGIVDDKPFTAGTSEWTKWAAPTTEDAKTKTITLAVAFPMDIEKIDGEKINYNDYQGKTANITFAVEAVQANGTAEYSPKAYVNTAAGLQDAIDAGATEIIFNEDVVLTNSLVIPAAPATYSLRNAAAPIVIDLNGNKITGATSDSLILNKGNLKIVGGTIENTAVNGGATLENAGTLILENVNVIGAPISGGTNYPSYCIRNAGNLTIEKGTNVSADRGCLFLSGTGETVINGGTFTNNDIAAKLEKNFTSHVVVVGYGANNKLTINGGTFQHLHTSTSGGVVINNWSAVTVEINGGNFSGGNYFGKWDNLSDYGYGSTKTPFSVKGGTFTGMDNKFLAAGYNAIANANGTYTVYANTASTTITLADGAVLDLGGVEFLGTVKALGDLTIKGDAKIKTLTAVNGGTITVEKTLTLNNFSFGAKDTAGAEYIITGGTITANYGFFQHGIYDLYSDFETGYMYYSYGSDITVYGTFHSQGKGDGLDYVRGKLTIANGGKSIHDKSLWVGQPASWGAMNASLTVEEGGYVQANSISVYDGSVAYNNAANVGVEGVGIKYNSLSGKISAIASDVTGLVAAINRGGEVTLVNDITATDIIFVEKSITINGNGYKVISPATRVFRVTNSNVEVALNDVNMVSNAVRVSSNDIRGISIDASLTNVKLTLNNCSVDFTDSSAHDWAYAVNVSGNGTGHTVIVNGGSYEGANVINANGAKNTIVVKNATLTSLYLPSVYENMYGACIWVQQNMGSSVEATGNTFNGDNAVAFNLGNGTTLTESNNIDNTIRIQ